MRSRRVPNTVPGARILRTLHREQSGFSLLELMVSMLIFSVVMGAALVGLGNTMDVLRNNKSRSVAANLAAQELDIVRSTTFANLPLGLYGSVQTVDSVAYRIWRYSGWVTKNATSQACDGVSGSQLAYLRITVIVRWPNMNGAQAIQSQTYLAPPVGSYDPNAGSIGVVVRDRSAVLEEGVNVTITGPGGSKSEVSDSDGCAFFAYLVAGTYTLTLSNASFVDGQGIAVPTQSIAVSNGTTTSLQFDYDLAATLSLTLQSPGGGTAPVAVNASVANTHLIPVGVKAVTGQSGTTRTVGNLFPYTDGYQAWAGTCADADPQGQKPTGGGPYYPGAQRDPALSTNPGLTTIGTIKVDSVRLHVLKNNVALAAATVTATHAADNSCAAGETYTFQGTTDSSGYLLGALPFGLWSFQVTGQIPKTSWPTTTLAPPADATVVALDVNVK
jgi:prepilin-type N-terminal cleavage/methylation domain-containing protein